MRLRTRRGFTLIAAVLAVTASSACVKQNEPGVGLVKFDSSTVFGAAKPTELPGFDVPVNFDNFPTTSGGLIPRNPLQPAPPTGPCPEAALTSFPKASATVKVIGTPTPGVYKWKRVAVQRTDRSKNPPVVDLPFDLESRALRRVTRVNDHSFTYEMVAPDPTNPDNTVITTYMVNNNPALLVDRTVPGRTIGVVPVPTLDLRYGTPGDSGGLYISKIETQNKAGGRISQFAPLQPVLILPMDGAIIRGGQTFQSIGIDPTSQTVLINSGTVLPPNRIDACGEIVEGWSVSLTQTFTSDIQTNDLVNELGKFINARKTRDLVMVFATQYGALPIRELVTIGRPITDQTAFVGQWELGGLTPTPLPDSIK